MTVYNKKGEALSQCPICHGRGLTQDQGYQDPWKCEYCDGEGWVTDKYAQYDYAYHQKKKVKKWQSQ